MKRTKIVLLIAIALVIIIGVIAIWKAFASPTRIAFVNYQAINLGQISKAKGDNSFIKITDLPVEELDKAGMYDMVLVNGMGLRLTDEQRQSLEKAAGNGTPVLTTAATNPQNLIVSVDSVDQVYLKQYLVGGKNNYRNLLLYIRKFIDGKKFFAETPADPEISSSSLIYYPGEDELNFNSVAQYEKYLLSKSKFNEKAPRIILTGQMGVPDSLVAALERSGNIVYPVNSIQLFIKEGHADSIKVAAMINMAHGRMGDMVVEYLQTNNIPLFSPLNVNRDYNEWMADKMGMNGGFLSQSVVTPEIDGAIRPFALFAHFKGDDGLPYVEAIPGRIEEFVSTVNNYISLQSKPNSDKKVAIFYFKGPGQNALVAEGMEVAPSLFNLLTRLKSEGYKVDNLPANASALERIINDQGKVFNEYAIGAKSEFVEKNPTEIIDQASYDKWCATSLSKKMRQEIDSVDGVFPGHGLKTTDGKLSIARLKFGNVVLIPQTAAGLGDDDFKIVHGTNAAPPHNYVAAYLWARNGFGADALIHFGAHGSLEFTPRKQVALGSEDWPDRLVGTVPHFYIYSTSNVGEAMIAKRRSYAGIINYLTPPFMESEVRGIYKKLSDAINAYNNVAGVERPDEQMLRRAAITVKKFAVGLGIHRELRLDSVLTEPYSADDIARIESFAEELANEKIMGALYVMGTPYSSENINSTIYAMTVDPIAYSLYNLDRHKGRTSIDYEHQRGQFTRLYGAKARLIVNSLLATSRTADDADVCRTAAITQAELDSARSIMASINGSKDLLSRMMVMGSMAMPASKESTAKIADRPNSSAMKKMMSKAGMSPEKTLEMAKKMGADEQALKKMKAAMKNKSDKKQAGPQGVSHGGGMMKQPEFTKQQLEFASAVTEVERTLKNVANYRTSLASSPAAELTSIVNALNGGYIAPTSGGDPVLNPNILPTGRNMFAVNAEETPSVVAWEKGKSLADNTISMYRKAHGDSLPRKVSYTLWSSEFIETEGATIAQVLYMLGVEPVRDPFGRVTDLKLIPSEELGRPRIDVVVQTSGQLRDLAASRLFLISRAVKMAAEAKDKDFPNYVTEGVVVSERHLVDKGVTPKEARKLSTARVFGGVNGNYGSGIQSMVEAGDRWENTSEIAETYINNMGAIYGSEEDWEKMQDFAFEAALTRTDVVVQPRQSNTWGALSLDHVYEFMGGMNLAVKNVTGKDPDAYLSDYRNRNNARMQEVKEAIGVESRTTLLNPNYIRNKMKGGAGDASGIADIVRNTYGWNTMKPDVIDNELWDDIYDTYVADIHHLGVKDFFTSTNPAAIEEITAVMLESSRKGMWKATPEQIAALAELHTEIVNEYKPSCSGFVCDNAKLRDYIASKVSKEMAAQYNNSIGSIRAEAIGSDNDGEILQKEELNKTEKTTSHINGVIVGAVVVIALVLMVIFIRRRKNRME